MKLITLTPAIFSKVFTVIWMLSLSSLSFAESADRVKVLLSTSEGDIHLELYANKAPKTVKNFVRYTKEGFYNDTLFHRVVDEFVIQGGGYDLNLQEKETHEMIANEASNGLKNIRGSLGMARDLKPNTAKAQFYINTVEWQEDLPCWDGGVRPTVDQPAHLPST